MGIWVAAGGTGGHVYPALAVVERWLEAGGESREADQAAAADSLRAEVVWVGGEGGVEKSLVERAGLPFVAIPAGGLHGVGVERALRNVWKLMAGTWRAWRFAGQQRPRAMLTTGGFVSAPVAVACWLRRVPILLYLPDIEPGLAVKFVAKFATRIGVTTDDSLRYFPARKTIVTGYPTRAEFAQADRATARRRFELVDDRLTLLITGGSKGARSLNRAVLGGLEELLAKYQVIHVSGTPDAAEVQARQAGLPDPLRPYYHAFEYVHDMGLALAAADLVVSRAGASALGEYPLFGLPSILVPYPYAWRYQRVNADYLASRGAAVRVNDEQLGEQLCPTIDRLLGDAAQLAGMRQAARALARPDPARALARALQELATA